MDKPEKNLTKSETLPNLEKNIKKNVRLVQSKILKFINFYEFYSKNKPFYFPHENHHFTVIFKILVFIYIYVYYR